MVYLRMNVIVGRGKIEKSTNRRLIDSTASDIQIVPRPEVLSTTLFETAGLLEAHAKSAAVELRRTMMITPSRWLFGGSASGITGPSMGR